MPLEELLLPGGLLLVVVLLACRDRDDGDDGPVDRRSIISRSCSRSRSSCCAVELDVELEDEVVPPVAFSRSMCESNCAPSARRLLTKLSTFSHRLFTDVCIWL